MRIEATTPAEYILKSPEDRQPYLNKLWDIITENIPNDFSAGMSYGFPSFVVPLAVFPPGYHCKKEEPLPFISIANQKNFIALYHMGMYANPKLYAWFVAEYPKHAKKKLDMGKSCIRFKTMDDIPFDLIGELVRKMTCQQWIDIYEGSLKR